MIGYIICYKESEEGETKVCSNLYDAFEKAEEKRQEFENEVSCSWIEKVLI